MKRLVWIFCNLPFILTTLSSDTPHSRVIDYFTIKKNWICETIDPQQYGPLYHVGVWSDPYDGPTFTVRQGKGLFHFPKLEAWVLEGFEYAFQLDAKTGDGFPEFEGDNYLCCNIQNFSSEPVSLKFRLLDDISYTYHYKLETGHYEALEELVTEPETIIIQPNKPPQKLRIKLRHAYIKDSTVRDIIYKNTLKFFTFEAHRTIAPEKNKPTIDCTLSIDNLRLEDGTTNKK